MKHGFIRCAAGTPEVAVADCQKNADRIIELIDSAGEEGVRFLVLPELCITGYTCGELFIQQSLLDAATAGLKRVVKATVGKQMIVIVGVPLSSFGKLYNCAAVIYEGEILGVVPKSNIPNYGEFYEARYFSPAPSNNTTVAIDGEQYPFGPKLVFVCEDMPQFTFAVEICEDLWVANSPSISHSAAGALIIGNLSAGNEVVGISLQSLYAAMYILAQGQANPRQTSCSRVIESLQRMAMFLRTAGCFPWDSQLPK
jgi:NAD+ synthase (glutamine-hydrolysing)